MAYTATDYAVAAWTYPTRTLVTGTPTTPSTAAETYAKAIWEAVPRTLTEATRSHTGNAIVVQPSIRANTADTLLLQRIVKSHVVDSRLVATPQLGIKAHDTNARLTVLMQLATKTHDVDAILAALLQPLDPGITTGPLPGEPCILVTGGKPSLGLIAKPGANHFSKFSVTQTGTYKIAAYGMQGQQSSIEVTLELMLDMASRSFIASDKRTGGGGNPAIVVTLLPGNYLVRARPRSQRGMARFYIEIRKIG